MNKHNIDPLLEDFKTKYNLGSINNQNLLSILLEMTKFHDKEITKLTRKYSELKEVIFDSYERKIIRLKIYYNHLDFIQSAMDEELVSIVNDNFILDRFTDETLLNAISYIFDRVKKDETKIIGTIKSRNELLVNETLLDDTVSQEYLQFINQYEQGYYNLAIIEKDAGPNSNATFHDILKEINTLYNNLLNYHYLAIVLNDNEDYTFGWDIISKVAIYCENFKLEDNFTVFKQNKQKDKLMDFIKNNDFLNHLSNDYIRQLADIFYSGVSYGFQYSDLFISSSGDKKVLVLQKIELDTNPIPCPDCMDNSPRGNSYNKLLYKSFECANVNCKSRSKSGRGKRYTYMSSKMQIKQRYLTTEDKVPDEIYKNFRRDIFDNTIDIREALIRLYSYSDDTIWYTGTKLNTDMIFNRKIENKSNESNNLIDYTAFEDLPIIKLLENIRDNIAPSSSSNQIMNNDMEIINGHSSQVIKDLKENSFKYAVTSPPYYNAREYSTWPNYVTYIIDMLINVKYIYQKMENNGVYLYNIGDIVDKDNIFVNSTMSNRRLMLGFYSNFIFDLAGFNTVGNFIWDKGEVQSKRNSTLNMAPYYVKTINCYEHIFIFKKQTDEDKAEQLQSITEIKSFPPVIKIGKGKVNNFGHTAPYPTSLVDLIKQFMEDDHRILDPYLGSGTTAVWCKNNKLPCLGIELNDDYYNLAQERIVKANEGQLNLDQLLFN